MTMLPVKALSKFFIPMSTVLHHRIQDSQLLAHTGYLGYFFGLTCGQKPLSLPNRLELSQPSFSNPGRLMGLLCSIIAVLFSTVDCARN